MRVRVCAMPKREREREREREERERGRERELFRLYLCPKHDSALSDVIPAVNTAKRQMHKLP